tara:strand:+ start:267 stop:485 length:219 start_codon:yes stop_codon:yes gene_type:complete
MKLGQLILVINKKKKSAANKKYWAVHCERGEANVTMLLTTDQMQDAEKRAKDNPEDIPPKDEPSFFAKLFGG